jgi:Fic family protein
VEDDDTDLTYFLLEQARVVRMAMDTLRDHVAKKVAEMRRVEEALRHDAAFNHRQLALLSHAMRHRDAEYTIASHRESHGVSYLTARSDLMTLEKADLLQRRRRGRVLVWLAAPDLDERLGR